MLKSKTTLDPTAFPPEIAAFLTGANTYDSSCSDTAKVYFIDKEPGYYLKVADAPMLEPEHLMHSYIHSLGLTSAVVAFQTVDGHNYLITERVPGDDGVSEIYLANPSRLCDCFAHCLRLLHEQPIAKCPIQNRVWPFTRFALNGYGAGHYNPDLFKGLWEFDNDQDAWAAAREGMSILETEVLIHGDYCLPNVMLNNWELSGFIDLINAGVGDRHIDVVWALYSLQRNLETDTYTDRFIDVYGRELIDREKLRCIAAMEMFC